MRPVSLGIGFAIAALLVLGGIWTSLEVLGVRPQKTSLRVVTSTLRQLRRLEEAKLGPSGQRVLWLGDSMIWRQRGQPSFAMALQVRVGQLTHSRPRAAIVALSVPGQSAFDYFFVSGIIAEHRPDQILLTINLTSMRREWHAQLGRPELAGWIPRDRLLQALHMPLDMVGLTADRLLYSTAVVGLGGGDAWVWLQRQQGRVNQAYGDGEEWLAARTGTLSPAEFGRRANLILRQSSYLVRRADGVVRWTEERMRSVIGGVMRGIDPDHPVLEMLGAAIDVYEEGGSQVLAYVTPINVEYLESLNLYDEAGLARTLASIRSAVTTNGGTFLDLHSLLPDRGFRDGAGHISWQGDYDGFERLIEALAPHVADEARASRRRKRRGKSSRLWPVRR